MKDLQGHLVSVWEISQKLLLGKNVLWAVGYFVCTVWEVNHEIIKKYVDEQWKEDVEGTEIEL